MLKPVLSSSLTTLFAFLPLLTIGGIIGTILHDIPIVVICVLIASIIECFFILPGHLKHSLKNIKAPSKRRQKLNKAIDNLRYVHYRNALNYCVNNARFICCLFLSLLFMCCCLCFSGRLPFNFFPMPESNLIFLDATFVNGTPDKQKMEFIKASTQALKKAEQALVTKGDPLISHIMAFQGRGNYPKGENSQMVSLQVERINQAHPDIKNQKLIKIWKQYLRQPTYLTQLNISQPKSGPPGKEIHIAITGNEDIKILAKGVSNIKKALSGYAGLYNIEDDLSQGNQQWVYHLKPMAYQHHIDAAQIATQLQSQLVGSTAMRIYRNIGKIKIKVQLTNKNQLSLGDLKYLPIIASDGQAYYLNDLVTWDSQANYDHIQRYNLKRVAQVFAEVNPKINNANQIIQSLKENTLPALKKQYGLNMTFKGRAEDQEKTLGDMRIGVIIALLLIYITLAWISESYWWPCLLLSTIPFALVGALVGHWLLNMPVTLLSLFGFFGLSGIVLNDSIILLLRFKSMRHQYPNIKEAIIHAACLRFRAILLTSLTTIGGLFPLLFEQSVQAQFLIPMAITIIFGLIVSTLVILFLVPTLITLCPNTERPALLEKQPNPS